MSVRARFPVLLVLVLGVVLMIPVTGLPGTGPQPVPTRLQTLALDEIASASGGRGMSGVGHPTAARSEVVQTEPFGLVGLTWDEPPAENSIVLVRVREESGWTSWLPLTFDDHHGPDPGSAEARAMRYGTDPMLTGKADAVQVMVQTPDGQVPPNTQVQLVDTDDVDVQQTPLAEAAAAPDKPRIITRAQWGADESKRNRGPLYSDVVKVGFVHHTVSSSTYTRAEAAAQVRNLYAYFTDGLKYSDMAYNFLVDRFGRLYEGRYGGMDRPVVGGHTAGLNNDSFAVSAMGNFDKFNPADAKMDAIKESIAKLMAWKLGLSKRNPAGNDTLVSTGGLGSGYWSRGETANLKRVSGHRDAGKTACPGTFLYDDVPAIRDRAAQIFRNNSDGVVEVPDLITPDPQTDEFNFQGSGYGDGVGVPKAGVLGQAREGRKAGRILRHYLAQSTIEPVDDTKVVWVSLGDSTRKRIDSSALVKGGGAIRVGTFTGGASSVLRASVRRDEVVVSGRRGSKWRTLVTAAKVNIRWAGTRAAGRLGGRATAVTVGADTLRRGTVSLYAHEGKVRAIAKLRVRDEYLPYVEIASRSWPAQAQRAIAIATRSRALAAQWDEECGCHLPDNGFLGQRTVSGSGYRNWAKAVRKTSGSETTGLVAAYDGGTINVPLFDSTGGATLNSKDVWGEDLPWARSVADPWSLQSKNTSYSSWDVQTRSHDRVAELFGLPDVALLDLRTRMQGGAVAKAIATSSDGQKATISGERLRSELSLPSAYIARSTDTEPVTATSLSTSISGSRKGSAVVVQASDTTVVALAAAYAGATSRPLLVVGSAGPGEKASKVLRRSRSAVAVGRFTETALKRVGRLAKLTRVTAADTAALSLSLARRGERSERRPVFVAAAGNPAAMASAAMGAVRSSGYLLATGTSLSDTAVAWVRKRASRSVVVASKKEIPDASAGRLRNPARLGTGNPVARSARIAALGSRKGDAILVDSARLMAAAAATASGQVVLLVAPKAANAGVVRYLQSSPSISRLRVVGAAESTVQAARRA